jgi:hypothetical protein
MGVSDSEAKSEMSPANPEPTSRAIARDSHTTNRTNLARRRRRSKAAGERGGALRVKFCGVVARGGSWLLLFNALGVLLESGALPLRDVSSK